MEPFEFFIKEKMVRRGLPNPERAKSLIKDAEMRIKSVLKLKNEEFAKIIFENIYDALRDFCDVLLLLDGFKPYSHKASISYLSKKGFDISIINELDQFRFKRNGSKYYGKEIKSEDAKDIKGFYFKIKDKIEKLIKEKLKNE